MSLRRRDVEQWMSHRRLPEDLRRYFSEGWLWLLFLLSKNVLLSTYLYIQRVKIVASCNISLFICIGCICRLVRDSERYTWAATRGVNEDSLMENLPEDLQREIRCHLFKFVKKVSL